MTSVIGVKYHQCDNCEKSTPDADLPDDWSYSARYAMHLCPACKKITTFNKLLIEQEPIMGVNYL